MGNEFSEEKEIKDKEPIEHSDDNYIKYGIISKKGGENDIDDTFISFSDLESSNESKNKIHFGLFGVFDGHNNVYVAKYLSDNFKNFFVKEAGDINDNNYQQKIQEIFKTIDKELKNYGKSNDEDKNNIDTNNINIGVDEKEIKYFKDLIQNTKEIPTDLKNVEDSQIKDLLLFRNLFKYNNNYLYSTTDVDYIGSSASIVFINNNNIITADLGITACILFDKEGHIINYKDNKENKDNKDLLKPIHVFENKSEKKRIKKFNEIEDYENLKYNIYAPASRCFGLFKYKADEILKEENQVISCIPEVNIYNRESVDFILLMTKGMINLFKDNPNELIEKIVKQYKEKKNEIKISEILNDIIEDKITEVGEKEKNEENKNSDKGINNTPQVKNNTIYVGREDFGEENEIINELKKNYYKDIMDLNKNNCYSCHDKYNITCILMKISKEKYPIIEVKDVVEENKIEEEKKDEKVKDNIEKKEEENQEEKKEEIAQNEIKNVNIDKEKEKEEEKNNEPIEENKNEIKDEEKENKEENKDEIKNEEKENKIEGGKGDENAKKEKNDEAKNNIKDDKTNIDEENKNKEDNEQKKE